MVPQKRPIKTGTGLIVTAEKDGVKLEPDISWDQDPAVIGIIITFENAHAFENFIRSRLKI